MASNITLTSIFLSTKEELSTSLSGLVLPKDLKEVQLRITNYLNHVCDEDNEFRQNLTQSEDYILQGALSLLNAQREMVSALSATPKLETIVVEEEENLDSGDNTPKKLVNYVERSEKNVSATNALIGSGGGALIGKFILGSWGAVFGAIAGTAISLYLSQQNPRADTSKPDMLRQSSKSDVAINIIDVPVDSEALLKVIGQLCESLDNLIATFRAQIQRVVDKYESQEKPTLEREYRTLLEGIQSLVGYKRGHSDKEDKYVGKLQERVEELAELLDNYDLEVVDYTPEKSVWFEIVESPNAKEIKLVKPAITKNGAILFKGKIFTPIK